MSKVPDILNGLIAADDLHWCEEENKYILLSMEEVDGILGACAEQGMTEDHINEVMKVVQWCEQLRAGQLLWKNFVAGAIVIAGFDENNLPMFTRLPNESESDIQ
jgi:hypothetical protein